MGGSEEFARAVVKKSVAKVCVELGYSSIQETALHAMMDLVTHFLHRFGVLMRINAEDYCSRSYNEVDDALYALDQMGISIDQIFSCVREFNPGTLQENIPLFPIPLHRLSTQSKQPVFDPSVDTQPPPSFYRQISITEEQESKAGAEEENKGTVTTPVRSTESSWDESCPNNAANLTPRQSQPTFLHINPTLASSSSAGMLPTSVTLQYDEERVVSENQMGCTPKKVALLKQNLLKKPNEHLEPMSENFTGTCSRKLRLGNDAGVNSPLKDDGQERSPATAAGKEKQGHENEDQGNVNKGTSSNSHTSSEAEKQQSKKPHQKEISTDHLDSAPLVKTLPIPPANAKAASAIDHETETEKVVEHRGMVIKTIKKDNALPVLQFPSLPKANKDTKRKTSAKKKESESSPVKLQINIGSKLAGRQRNKSGTPKQTQPKNSTASVSKEVVESSEATTSAVATGVKVEPEETSNINVANSESDYDNTEVNSSRELEPSEESSVETMSSTQAASESVSQPEATNADLRNICGSFKQEFADESPITTEQNEQPPKAEGATPFVQESVEYEQAEPFDLSQWNPQHPTESVDTASAMFDDALASPPDRQTRIFGNINTPISIPETPDIGSTPISFGAGATGDETHSTSSVFAHIFNYPPRVKSEPVEFERSNETVSVPPEEANDGIERPLTPLSEVTFETPSEAAAQVTSQVTTALNVQVEVKEEIDYVDGGDETDAESDANKLFSPCLDGGNSSPRANSDCLDTLTSDSTLIGYSVGGSGGNSVDPHTFGVHSAAGIGIGYTSRAALRDRPGNILAEIISSAANDDDDEIEVPPSPDLPPPTPSTSNEIPRSPILDDDLNSGPNSVDRSSPTSIVPQCQPPIFLYQRQSVIVCNPATTNLQNIVQSSTSQMGCRDGDGRGLCEPDDVSSTTQPSLLSVPHYVGAISNKKSGSGGVWGADTREVKGDSFSNPPSPERELFAPSGDEEQRHEIPLQNPEVSCASEGGVEGAYFSQQLQHTASSILQQAQTTSAQGHKSSGTHSHKSSKEKDRSSGHGHGRKRKHSSEHKSKKKHKKMKREYVEMEENGGCSFKLEEETTRKEDDTTASVFAENDSLLHEEEDEEEMPMLKLTLKFGGKSVTIGREGSKQNSEKPLHVKTTAEPTLSKMASNSPPNALDMTDTRPVDLREEPPKKTSGGSGGGSKRGKDESMKDLLQKAELMQTDFSAKSSANQNSGNGGGSHGQSTADLLSPITPVGIREIDFANTSPNLPPLQGTAPTSCYDSTVHGGGDAVTAPVGVSSGAAAGLGVDSAAFTYVPQDASADNQEWICPACSQPDNGTSPMIGCDRCDAWYHWQCLGIITEPSSEQWFCPKCVLLQQATTASQKSSKSGGSNSSNGGGKKKSNKKTSSGSSKKK